MSGFLQNLGLSEIIVIGLILILFFGGKKIAELGKAAGETTKEFKKIKKEYSEAVTEVKNVDEVKSDEV